MKTIKGDLLEFPDEINIAFQGCNVWSRMGSGLAKQVAEKRPEAQQADFKFPKKGKDRLGHFSFAIGDDGNMMVNLYQQNIIGGSPDNIPFEIRHYCRALDSALEYVTQTSLFDDVKLGFPKNIGCDLARGDWNYVRPITEWLVEKYKLEGIWVDYEKD